MGGLVGVRCVRGNMTMDEHYRCQREEVGPPCGIDPTVLHMITRPKLERVGVIFSPSSIASCHRQHALQKDYAWYVDVEKAYQMVRGDIIHAGLSQEPYPPGTIGMVRELRMHFGLDTRYGKQVFSGQVDAIVLNGIDSQHRLHVKITDYKSKNDIKHELVEADRRHTYQVNEYAWLVTRALRSYLEGWHHEETPYGKARLFLNLEACDWYQELPDVTEVVVDELSIFYMSSNKTRTFTSRGFLYTKGKMLGETGTDGHWHAYSPHRYEELELAPLHFFDLDYTEGIIRAGIESQMDGEDHLADPLVGDDAKLMCGNCPVKQACYDIGKAQGLPMDDQRPFIERSSR